MARKFKVYYTKSSEIKFEPSKREEQEIDPSGGQESFLKNDDIGEVKLSFDSLTTANECGNTLKKLEDKHIFVTDADITNEDGSTTTDSKNFKEIQKMVRDHNNKHAKFYNATGVNAEITRNEDGSWRIKPDPVKLTDGKKDLDFYLKTWGIKYTKNTNESGTIIDIEIDRKNAIALEERLEEQRAKNIMDVKINKRVTSLNEQFTKEAALNKDGSKAPLYKIGYSDEGIPSKFMQCTTVESEKFPPEKQDHPHGIRPFQVLNHDKKGYHLGGYMLFDSKTGEFAGCALHDDKSPQNYQEGIAAAFKMRGERAVTFGNAKEIFCPKKGKYADEIATILAADPQWMALLKFFFKHYNHETTKKALEDFYTNAIDAHLNSKTEPAPTISNEGLTDAIKKIEDPEQQKELLKLKAYLDEKAKKVGALGVDVDSQMKISVGPTN
jgi:hypothetical protein